MSRKVIDTLILDLDNTIFDWFALWYASFEPVYRDLLAKTDLPAAEVEAAIRRVHQSRRTSEYTFLLEEIDILADLRQAEDIRTTFASSLGQARAARDQSLKLYSSVFRCLWDIKQKGTKIVAYTESMGFYSAYRLKRFGLDGVIDVLFSPEDHDTPAGVSLDKLRHLPDDFYELQVTETKHTPPGELKPNPRVLLDIIKSVGAKAERCAYVGDSLFKDVAMARDVGVFDIHARYGESQRKPEYALLQRVSHWTEEDVRREAEITAKGHDFEPTATLKDTFAEVFIYCDFVDFDQDLSSADELKNTIDIWKTTVGVQQHFNDLQMRIRNFAITVVGALIAAVGVTYQQKLQTNIFGRHFAAGLGVIIAAGFAWFSFFLMDKYWYHVFLKGAVEHAKKIETDFASKIPGIGLGKSISEVSSNVRILGVKTNSDRRLYWFYILGFLMLGTLFMTLFMSAPYQEPVPAPAPAPASNAASAPAPSLGKP